MNYLFFILSLTETNAFRGSAAIGFVREVQQELCPFWPPQITLGSVSFGGTGENTSLKLTYLHSPSLLPKLDAKIFHHATLFFLLLLLHALDNKPGKI